MEITKCEFCNTRIANCEVHNCVRFGNQYRQTSATLPQDSSANLAEDIELITADEMEYEARWPSMSQGNSSNQRSFLFDMQTDCEETAAAEIYSRYDASTHDQYNPAISDFHFLSKLSVEENEYTLVNLQQLSEPSEVLRSQNSQPSDATCSGHTANIPLSPAEQGILPGFQQTFGQRNVLKNRMAELLKDSAQTEYSGMSRTKEVLCSTRNLFHPTNIADQTENFSFTTLTRDDPLENLAFSSNSLCGYSEEYILNTSETENSNIITGPISTPVTSHFFVENQESCVINLHAMKCKVVENNPKNSQCTYEIADSVSCASNSNETKPHFFESEIINNTKLYISENSCSGSSKIQKACNISTTSIANESNSTHKKHSEDKILSKYVNSYKDMDTPSGNTRKPLDNCHKDRNTFQPSEHLEFPERSYSVAKPYNCSFCDKKYSNNSNLKRHVRTHTGHAQYPCTKCSKSFTRNSHLQDHLRTHTGEKPFQCTKCGKCFNRDSHLRDHLRTHTGEKPYACNKCSERYTRNSSLKRHLLKHVGEERSKCDSCGTEFSSEESLGAHQCGKNK